MKKDAYLIYVEHFGKVKSGSQVDHGDYIEDVGVDCDITGHLAVSLAVLDAKTGTFLRSKSEFNEEIKRLSDS
jgi:hypothetical protein